MSYPHPSAQQTASSQSQYQQQQQHQQTTPPPQQPQQYQPYQPYQPSQQEPSQQPQQHQPYQPYQPYQQITPPPPQQQQQQQYQQAPPSPLPSPPANDSLSLSVAMSSLEISSPPAQHTQPIYGQPPQQPSYTTSHPSQAYPNSYQPPSVSEQPRRYNQIPAVMPGSASYVPQTPPSMGRDSQLQNSAQQPTTAQAQPPSQPSQPLQYQAQYASSQYQVASATAAEQPPLNGAYALSGQSQTLNAQLSVPGQPQQTTWAGPTPPPNQSSYFQNPLGMPPPLTSPGQPAKHGPVPSSHQPQPSKDVVGSPIQPALYQQPAASGRPQHVAQTSRPLSQYSPHGPLTPPVQDRRYSQSPLPAQTPASPQQHLDQPVAPAGPGAQRFPQYQYPPALASVPAHPPHQPTPNGLGPTPAGDPLLAPNPLVPRDQGTYAPYQQARYSTGPPLPTGYTGPPPPAGYPPPPPDKKGFLGKLSSGGKIGLGLAGGAVAGLAGAFLAHETSQAIHNKIRQEGQKLGIGKYGNPNQNRPSHGRTSSVHNVAGLGVAGVGTGMLAATAVPVYDVYSPGVTVIEEVYAPDPVIVEEVGFIQDPTIVANGFVENTTFVQDNVYVDNQVTVDTGYYQSNTFSVQETDIYQQSTYLDSSQDTSLYQERDTYQETDVYSGGGYDDSYQEVDTYQETDTYETYDDGGGY